MLETLRAQLEEKSAAYQTLSSDLGAKVTDGEKREEALQEK